MGVRLLATPAVRGPAEGVARDAAVATLPGSTDAFDVAVLGHADVAALLADRKADPGFCSDLGRLRDRTAGDGGLVYTVAIAPGGRGDSITLARRLAASRRAAGFEGVSIRRATGADTIAARAMVFEVLAEYGFAPEPTATDADLMDLDAGFLADGGMFDVAIGSEGGLAACCGMKVLSDGRLELRKMYVRKALRGQGLGQRLLDRALAWARARGHPRVELETASVLKEAIALYRKAGFIPRPGKPDTCRCDQAFVLALD